MKRMRLILGIILLIIILAIGGLVYYLEKKVGAQLIGGCKGINLDNLQECCDNWARKNGVFVIACVGEWEIRDNKCAWECESEENVNKVCTSNADCEDNLQCLICGSDERGLTKATPGSAENPGLCALGCI